jgi:deazaflavin-dependent oxidoreductase (nitroreductase family)
VSAHYRAPGWFARNVFNRAVEFLTQRGVSVLGSRVLAVRGRTSGVWRTAPVNLLDHDGHRYVVSARGEGQWVRNLRAAGTGELRVGRRTEAFRGRELSDEEKVRCCAPT